MSAQPSRAAIWDRNLGLPVRSEPGRLELESVGDCWSLVQNFGGAPTRPYGTIVKSALARQAAADGG
jgi:hypothetical protein